MLRESQEDHDVAAAIPFARGGGISETAQKKMHAASRYSRGTCTENKKLPTSVTSEEAFAAEQKEPIDQRKMKSFPCSPVEKRRTISIEVLGEEDETFDFSNNQGSPVIEDMGGGIFLKFEKDSPLGARNKKKEKKIQKRKKVVLPVQFAKLPRIEQELKSLVSDLAECATVLPMQKLHEKCQRLHISLQETLKDVYIPQPEDNSSSSIAEQKGQGGNNDVDPRRSGAANQVALSESAGFELGGHRLIEDPANIAKDNEVGVSTESQPQLRSTTISTAVVNQPEPKTRAQKKAAAEAEAENQGHEQKKNRRGKRERRRSY
eukprot:CAMPEP_0116040030 /NCGR_PEP_ID=MMETSP0321-20121206/24052_1 /TAXON_ID=163516 /ORGANISM="Leptocylindrus danicus var. danicus, Strain B650" /LENGTH=319 /DNA_ID=CAMNT_0003519639 /DNA_START=241 /DNA_END=1200 /DNA_ORIENTATION=+